MKKFKTVSNIMLIIAISLFLLSFVISVITELAGDLAFITLVEVNIIVIACAGVGAFLIFTKNDIAKKLGNGMIVVGFVAGLICALSVLIAMDEGDDLPIGALIMIISVVLLLLHYAFLLVAHLLNKGSANVLNPNEDARIMRVKEWKALLDEGIINEEEYEEKRVQILGLKPKDTKETQE